jgi:hypothetical protein
VHLAFEAENGYAIVPGVVRSVPHADRIGFKYGFAVLCRFGKQSVRKQLPAVYG